jgi:hypothetical protein
MSAKSAKNENVLMAAFGVVPATYPTAQCSLLLQYATTNNIANNLGSNLSHYGEWTLYAPDGVTPVTGYGSLNLLTDGIYNISIKLNNDYQYAGTPPASASSAIWALYFYANKGNTSPPNWVPFDTVIQCYNRWDTVPQLQASITIDTRVIGSKEIRINTETNNPMITTIPSTYHWEGVLVTKLSS